MASHVIDSVFFKDLYGSAEMRAVFDDHNLLQKWLDYEAALARAEAGSTCMPHTGSRSMVFCSVTLPSSSGSGLACITLGLYR